MRMHPYRTPSNVIAGVVISFIDITKLKQAEAALRDAVAERQRAEEALREADRRKDQFLAVLSHELRKPLAPIRNSLHLLDRVLGAAAARGVTAHRTRLRSQRAGSSSPHPRHRRQPGRRRQPSGGAFLIALTGYALPEDQRQAKDAGFDAHLAKPTTIEQLRIAIARAP
jgi:signal transduction histidine kinase